MTVSSTTNRNDYVGNDAVDTYSYTFRILDQTHLRVTVRDTSSPPVETTLTLTTNYTVSGVGDAGGGSVALVNGSFSWLDADGDLKSGYSLTIRRVLTIKQETDLRNQGSFYAETHEDQFDRAAMVAQQQQDEIDRALSLPETEAGSSAATTLPISSERASKFLAFDASGRPIASSGSNGVPATAFAATVLDDSDADSAIQTYIAALTAETAVAKDDTLILGDTSEAKGNKVTLENALKVLTLLTAETAPAVDDELLLYDLSAATADKVTLANMLKVLNVLTEDTTPDPAADFALVYDASAAAVKKVLLNKFSSVPRGYLDGCTMSTAGSSATMSISAGSAVDSGNTALMELAAIAKTTSAWAVGTGNGGLDSGAIANNLWYHFFVIKRTDTGVVDVLISLSATAPTMPTGYTLKRRIGSGKTNGAGQWTLFTQVEDVFDWADPVVDVDASNPGTSAVTRTLTVPIGVAVQAKVVTANHHGSTAQIGSYISPLHTTDTAPQANATTALGAPFTFMGSNSGAAAWIGGPVLEILTNTSAQIRSRLNASGAYDRIGIITLGWIDARGRNA